MNLVTSARCVVRDRSTVCCTLAGTCACASTAPQPSNRTRVGSAPSVEKTSVMSSRFTARDEEGETFLSSPGGALFCLVLL